MPQDSSQLQSLNKCRRGQKGPAEGKEVALKNRASDEGAKVSSTSEVLLNKNQTWEGAPSVKWVRPPIETPKQVKRGQCRMKIQK